MSSEVVLAEALELQCREEAFRGVFDVLDVRRAVVNERLGHKRGRHPDPVAALDGIEMPGITLMRWRPSSVAKPAGPVPAHVGVSRLRRDQAGEAAEGDGRPERAGPVEKAGWRGGAVAAREATRYDLTPWVEHPAAPVGEESTADADGPGIQSGPRGTAPRRPSQVSRITPAAVRSPSEGPYPPRWSCEPYRW